MERRNFLKAFVGFVGTLGTTKLVAAPKDKIQYWKEKPVDLRWDNKRKVWTSSSTYKPYNIHHATPLYRIFTVNNCEFEVLDIVYKDKDGRITKEPHGNPFGVVTQATRDWVYCQLIAHQV